MSYRSNLRTPHARQKILTLAPGDVKIFDFGLAKEIDVNAKLDDGTYKLTGDTGSLRYMAPEGKANTGLFMNTLWSVADSDPSRAW